MTTRATWMCVAGFMVITVVIGGCTKKVGYDNSGGKYDVVIAICHGRLAHVTSYCKRIEESDKDFVWANVIFGRAGGHEVAVGVEPGRGASRGDLSGANRVAPDHSFLHAVRIPRVGICKEANCEFTVQAIVDGRPVASKGFAFVGR